MTFDETFISDLEGFQEKFCIHNVLDINEINAENNEPQLIRRSSYYEIDKFHLLTNSNTDTISILSSNIQSLIAKFDEL